MGIGLQSHRSTADPDRVSFSATSASSAQGIGLANVRSRITEIQRLIGLQAAFGGVPLNAPAATAPATGSGAAGTASFERALQQAKSAVAESSATLGAASTGGLGASAATTALLEALGTTPVYATKPDGLPPVAVSETMQAAGNGQLPESMLQAIGQGEHRLSKPAADAFVRLTAAARKDGVTFGVNDSYRSYLEQVELAERLGLYGQGGLAAVPGTSNHGWGLAVDLELDDRAQAWMRENAWRYGFFEDVPGESWHWTYRSAT